jgi:hypothetical protein
LKIRLTAWELDQLRFAAENGNEVVIASKDLIVLLDEIADSRKEEGGR